ncbi:unnamed protein product, partial [Ectocarpus sp. 13 AM-2016]
QAGVVPSPVIGEDVDSPTVRSGSAASPSGGVTSSASSSSIPEAFAPGGDAVVASPASSKPAMRSSTEDKFKSKLGVIDRSPVLPPASTGDVESESPAMLSSTFAPENKLTPLIAVPGSPALLPSIEPMIAV